MNEQIIGIKQLYTNLKEISHEALYGQSFIVVKNSKPVFKIEPIETQKKKKYNLKDLKKIQFIAADKNLSKNIDKIVY